MLRFEGYGKTRRLAFMDAMHKANQYHVQMEREGRLEYIYRKPLPHHETIMCVIKWYVQNE